MEGISFYEACKMLNANHSNEHFKMLHYIGNGKTKIIFDNETYLYDGNNEVLKEESESENI